jgi:hypothetical protein
MRIQHFIVLASTHLALSTCGFLQQKHLKKKTKKTFLLFLPSYSFYLALLELMLCNVLSFCFVCVWQQWDLKSGPHTCRVDALTI